MKNYKEILKGKSDEELLALAESFRKEQVVMDSCEEAGLNDFLDECCGFVQKLSKVPFIGACIVEINLLISMLRDCCKREFSLSIKTILILTGALAYLISPVDLIPDALPVIGYLDDATVIKAALNSIMDDIDKYKAYTEEYLDISNNIIVHDLIAREGQVKEGSE